MHPVKDASLQDAGKEEYIALPSEIPYGNQKYTILLTIKDFYLSLTAMSSTRYGVEEKGRSISPELRFTYSGLSIFIPYGEGQYAIYENLQKVGTGHLFSHHAVGVKHG